MPRKCEITGRDSIVTGPGGGSVGCWAGVAVGSGVSVATAVGERVGMKLGVTVGVDAAGVQVDAETCGGG